MYVRRTVASKKKKKKAPPYNVRAVFCLFVLWGLIFLPAIQTVDPLCWENTHQLFKCILFFFFSISVRLNVFLRLQRLVAHKLFRVVVKSHQTNFRLPPLFWGEEIRVSLGAWSKAAQAEKQGVSGTENYCAFIYGRSETRC